MATGKKARQPGGDARTLIEDADGRRPFMRGIMVHSLLSRGASFDEAYDAASQVRDKIRGREIVPRAELGSMIEELFSGRLEERPLRLPREIAVVRDGHRAVFSKGVLAQSLLAAAVAPDDAFDVAAAFRTVLAAGAFMHTDHNNGSTLR